MITNDDTVSAAIVGAITAVGATAAMVCFVGEGGKVAAAIMGDPSSVTVQQMQLLESIKAFAEERLSQIAEQNGQTLRTKTVPIAETMAPKAKGEA